MFNFIHKRKIQTCLRFLVDFLKGNMIHCTSYLTKTSIHWCELIFWIITILLFINYGIYSAVDIFNDFKSRNSAITVNTEYMNFETFFPSLTLCPQNILNQKKVNKFISNLYCNISDKERYYWHIFLHMLSKPNGKSSPIKNIKRKSALNLFQRIIDAKIEPESYMELLFNLSNNYDLKLKNKWPAFKIMTEIGICYTFNNFLNATLSTRNWQDSNPYPKNLSDYPPFNTRTFNFTYKFPLRALIQHNINGNINVYAHSPYEVPTIWSRSTVINSPTKLSFNIREINHKKISLKQISPEERQCRSIKESNLKVYPFTYSRNLCLIDCYIQRIQNYCNCIPHFYAHKNLTDIKICDVKGLSCLNELLDKFREKYRNSSSISRNCTCLPNCIEQIVLVKSSKSSNRRRNYSGISCAITYPPLLSYQRSIMYEKLDYVVAISGVLSSFFGFCAYSLCDFIYFFTVRLYWFRRGYRGSVDEVVF